MPRDPSFPIAGGCTCRKIRYQLETLPLVVHCCHCTWCQRESGASFALNAMLESDRLTLLAGAPVLIDTPTASGRGQQIARCPNCQVAVWSHYSSTGPLTRFVRVGTLDDPDALPPDVHIFTTSKQAWVVIPDAVPAFSEYYDRNLVWRADSLQRLQALTPKIQAWRAEATSRSAP